MARFRIKERNAVERCVVRLEQWRGLAPRTDELAITSQAALHVAAVLIRVRCRAGRLSLASDRQLPSASLMPKTPMTVPVIRSSTRRA